MGAGTDPPMGGTRHPWIPGSHGLQESAPWAHPAGMESIWARPSPAQPGIRALRAQPQRFTHESAAIARSACKSLLTASRD